MVFTEPRFVVLVVLCWITFFAVPKWFRAHALAFWGVAFYVQYAPHTIWLVGGLVVLTYLLDGRSGRWGVVAVLLALFAYFKQPANWTTAHQSGGLMMPLGYSFMALELMHYAIERGRGRIRDASLPNLAAFALFFPCRIAGPIKRHNDFTTAVSAAEYSADNVLHGCLRILSGLFKKLALADLLGRSTAPVVLAATPIEAWTAMLAYSLELYLDFSAYSDLAIGVSRLMGIRVPENFRWPYLSPNIQDFWTRWHISLSSWARDYIFIAVGRQLFKTRLKALPGAIAAISYLATFLAVGAWHGLSLNFLIWGAYHGLLVTAFHFYKQFLPAGIAASLFYQSRVVAVAGTVFTFFLVTIGWVFFRMDLPDAVRVLRLMLNA